MQPFEIFKTGEHTSDKGIKKDYSVKDLDKIVSNYNPEDHEAPIVIGHPETNAPAYGWIEKLTRVGEKLMAVPKQVNEAFSEMVRDGSFKKRSISLSNDLQLNHVGFLGAAAPAIKGLSDIEFAADLDYVEFNIEVENDPENKKDLKNNIIKKETVVVDENLTNQLEELSTQFSALQKQVDNFADTGMKQEDLDKIYERMSDLRFSIQTNEFELMLNERLAYGSVTPGMKTKIMKVVNFLQKQNFSSSEFKQTSFIKEVETLFTDFVNSIPKILFYEEVAEKGENIVVETDSFGDDVEIDSESMKLHTQATAIAAKDKITYLEAVEKVTAVNLRKN